MKKDVIYKVQNGAVVDFPNIAPPLFSREGFGEAFQCSALNWPVAVVQPGKPCSNDFTEIGRNSLAN